MGQISGAGRCSNRPVWQSEFIASDEAPTAERFWSKPRAIAHDIINVVRIYRQRSMNRQSIWCPKLCARSELWIASRRSTSAVDWPRRRGCGRRIKRCVLHRDVACQCDVDPRRWEKPSRSTLDWAKSVTAAAVPSARREASIRCSSPTVTRRRNNRSAAVGDATLTPEA